MLEVTALRLQLLDAGWTPVPSSPRDKSCKIPDWPTLDVTEHHIENWARTHPAHSNTALVCSGNYFAADIDILSDPQLARHVHALAFKHLGVTPFIRIGRAPKLLLVYRCLPGSIRSVSFKSAAGNNDGIDILATARNFTSFGIHPDTRRPYVWVGPANPLDDTPADAPLVAQAQVDAFLDAAHQAMPFARSTGDVRTGRPAAGDPHRVIDDDGKIRDGRESLLRDAIWRAAHDVVAAGKPLTAQVIADAGWDTFAARAYLEDDKWDPRDALIKARALMRRVNAGIITIQAPPVVAPSYPTTDNRLAEAARQELLRLLQTFTAGAQAWATRQPDAAQQAVDQLLGGARAPVWAAQVSTGVGKTRLCAETIAADRLARQATGETGPLADRPWLYLVPTHRLGDDIAAQFVGHGITAKVFRGREALVPGDPETHMCLNLKQVRLALDAKLIVSSTCCKRRPKGGREQRCEFYDTCAYQQQLRSEKPDVWIAAHEALFHHQPAFGDVAGVIIDESFWQDGLRISKHGIGLAEIATSLIPPMGKDDVGADLDMLRTRLTKALRAQSGLGGVTRDSLAGVTADDCTQAIRLEWRLIEHLKIWPGMPARDMDRAAKRVPSVRRARQMIAIWGAARELIERPEIAVSGRLVLGETNAGERILKHHGVARIKKQWNVPTLIMDATLPDMPILQAYFPQAMLVAQIEADMPDVRIRQILNAPVSAKRLIKTGSNINRKAVRRHILQRWIETGRQPTLVVCQQKVEDWLAARGLPAAIAVEHFNNISGIDRYKDVRLLILVGRTIPGPEAVETMAGALTGAEPIKAATASNGTGWYERVVRGIRLPDNSGVAVDCDRHPDPTAEAVRWQICEGELMQALGRGRGVNRTADTPLDIDIVADVCLPVTVDEVQRWSDPTEVVEMAVEGIVLTSPVDMVCVWPRVWPNERAAKRTLEVLIRLCPSVPKNLVVLEGTEGQSACRIYYQALCPSVRTLIYQLDGPKLKRRTAYVDMARLPDPRAWLEHRLGSLAYFAIEEGSK